MRRSEFLRFVGTVLLTMGGGPVIAGSLRTSPAAGLRPPGAVPEAEFDNRCIHCHLCAEACSHGAIVVSAWGSLSERDTPYIHPRASPCRLCLHCTAVCPTGALQRIENNPAAIQRAVHMGVARIDTGSCIAWQSTGCLRCYYQCPYPDAAITLDEKQRPLVHPEQCVGCGICEFACVTDPAAIIVSSAAGLAAMRWG